MAVIATLELILLARQCVAITKEVLRTNKEYVTIY